MLRKKSWMTAKQWVIVSSQSFLASAVTTLCKPSHYVYIVTHSMCVLSHVWLFVTSWTVAHQAPLSMEFSKPEYWSELPLLSPRDLPDPEIELMSPVSPALQVDSFQAEPLGKPPFISDLIEKISNCWEERWKGIAEGKKRQVNSALGMKNCPRRQKTQRKSE